MENEAECPHRGYVDIWNCILLQAKQTFLGSKMERGGEVMLITVTE